MFAKLYDLVTKIINAIFNGIAQALLELINKMLSNNLQIAIDLLHNPLVSAVLDLTINISIAFVGCLIAWDTVKNYILYVNGEPNGSPQNVIFRGIFAIVTIKYIPFFAEQILNVGNYTSQAVGSIMVNYSAKTALGSINAALLFLGSTFSYFSLLLVIVFITCMVICIFIFLQSYIRAATIIGLVCTAPILALGIISGNRSGFNQYLRNLIILSLTQALQIFLLQMGFYEFTKAIGGGLPGLLSSDGMLFIAFIWVSLKSPSVLKEYAFSGGGDGGGGGSGSGMGQAVMSSIASKAFSGGK